MPKVAVILYGPPGSGKGTQANLLADRADLIHFDTGKFLENLVHDPARQKEKTIRKEKVLFDSGKLLTPSFVLREVAKETKRLAKAGWGVVFSGSPRTLYEAENLLPILESLYGKSRVKVFILKVPESESMTRNSARVVCVECKRPLLTKFYPSKKPKHCPVCAGAFYRRTLDNPKTITVRLAEYRNRTEPIFALMKKRGYHLRIVNGMQVPYQVARSIYGQFKNIR